MKKPNIIVSLFVLVAGFSFLNKNSNIINNVEYIAVACGSQATTTGDVACAIASGAAVACGKAAFSAYVAAGTMLAATPAGWAIGAVVLVG